MPFFYYELSVFIRILSVWYEHTQQQQKQYQTHIYYIIIENEKKKIVGKNRRKWGKTSKKKGREKCEHTIYYSKDHEGTYK